MTLLKFSTVIAFVALLETLISAKTADGMSKTRFDQRKEAFGVGLANIASGIFGGMPASGVFARTALNVKSGAKSRYSQIINAVSVAVISVVFISGFSYLPLSIIASILVFVAVRMVTAEHFKKLYRFDKATFILSIVVALITFGIDATTGILVGTSVALFMFANKLSGMDLGSDTDPDNFNPEEDRGKVLVYRFAGPLTYLNSKTHIERINNLTGQKPVVFNMRHLHYIDVDGYEVMDEILDSLKEKNTPVCIVGVRPEMLDGFRHHECFETLWNKKMVVNTTEEAMSKFNKISLQ